jgi:hypothetical protein
MTRVDTNRITAVLALAGIFGACALVGVTEYKLAAKPLDLPSRIALWRPLYDRCVAEIRKSAAHKDFWDLEIDAKCPVKPEELPGAASVTRTIRRNEWQQAGAILALCVLPWVVSRFKRHGSLAVVSSTSAKNAVQGR